MAKTETAQALSNPLSHWGRLAANSSAHLTEHLFNGVIAVILPLMMLFGLASNLAYALIGSLLRESLAKGARLLWFNRLMAAVLVATACWMATL